MNIDTKRNITKKHKSIETELSHLIAFRDSAPRKMPFIL